MQAILISVLGQFILHLLGSMVTEKYVASLVFYLVEWLSKQTANGLDDKVVSGLKEAYYAGAEVDRREEPRAGEQAPAPVVNHDLS